VTTSAACCRIRSGLSAWLQLAPCHGLYPTSPPLTKGRDEQGDASRTPGHFPHGRKTHQPLLQRAFQEMTRPNLPTHLGEDPKKCLITTEVTTTFFISPCTPIAYTAFLRPIAVSRFKYSNTANRSPLVRGCVQPFISRNYTRVCGT